MANDLHFLTVFILLIAAIYNIIDMMTTQITIDILDKDTDLDEKPNKNMNKKLKNKQ